MKDRTEGEYLARALAALIADELRRRDLDPLELQADDVRYIADACTNEAVAMLAAG